MTSYCPTIGQLKCVLAAIGKLVCVLAYHWSIVLYDVFFFIGSIKSFETQEFSPGTWSGLKMNTGIARLAPCSPLLCPGA